jgi:hypothetical protein
MTKLTPEQQTALAAWYGIKQAAIEAMKIIERERELRLAALTAFAELIPCVTEGTVVAELPDGWKLKRTVSYTRKVDATQLESIRALLAQLHVSLDKLVDWKPSLITRQYRQLTEEARAIVDSCITTTPNLPTLDLVPPKGE